MNEPFEKVKGLLDMGNSQVAKAVIIYGFGGSGKTTLAEYVVSNLPLQEFKSCVIRIDERNLDIKKLQEQILFKVRGQNIVVTDSIDGKNKLRDALKDRLCFLLIDNITDKNQIKELLPQDLCLSPGSRMLITSRSSDVKEKLPREILWEEYPVKTLPDEKAVELLRKIVFNKKQDVTSDDKHKVEDIAKACGGVPLLLTVFGEYLRVHWSESAYKQPLDSLKEGGGRVFEEEDLSNQLLYVYHRLRTQDTKDAFVDICTFFHGWRRRIVSDIVGEYELQSLQEGALVKITERDEVIVHDILRLMGIKEGRDTRLQSIDDLRALLDDDQALRKVKGVCLKTIHGPIFKLNSEHINKISNSLRILHLGDGILLERLCEGPKFKNLISLAVEGPSFDTFPLKDASKFEKLAHISLIRCERLSSLPADFGELRSLKRLEIDGPSLTELTPGFGQLDSLTDLSLWDCPDLERVSSDFECLTSLRRLRMFWCPKLEAATMEKVVKLKNLSKVHIYGSEQLVQAWEEMQNKEDVFCTVVTKNPLVAWKKRVKPTVTSPPLKFENILQLSASFVFNIITINHDLYTLPRLTK